MICLWKFFLKQSSIEFLLNFFFKEHDRSCLENALERDCANYGQRFAQAARCQAIRDKNSRRANQRLQRPVNGSSQVVRARSNKRRRI